MHAQYGISLQGFLFVKFGCFKKTFLWQVWTVFAMYQRVKKDYVYESSKAESDISQWQMSCK